MTVDKKYIYRMFRKSIEHWSILMYVSRVGIFIS